MLLFHVKVKKEERENSPRYGNHKTGLITVQQKLACEAIFSNTFCDWFNK